MRKGEQESGARWERIVFVCNTKHPVCGRVPHANRPFAEQSLDFAIRILDVGTPSVGPVQCRGKRAAGDGGGRGRGSRPTLQPSTQDGVARCVARFSCCTDKRFL